MSAGAGFGGCFVAAGLLEARRGERILCEWRNVTRCRWNGNLIIKDSDGIEKNVDK